MTVSTLDPVLVDIDEPVIPCEDEECPGRPADWIGHGFCGCVMFACTQCKDEYERDVAINPNYQPPPDSEWCCERCHRGFDVPVKDLIKWERL